MLISGAWVYPEPAFVNTSSLIEKTPARSVVMATADAFEPPALLDVDIDTVGTDVYPLPSFWSEIDLKYPDIPGTFALTVAVAPTATRLRVVINPSSSISRSISSTPVSIISSSYSKSSHWSW